MTMEHKVIIKLPERQIGKSDVFFRVNRNGRRFGRLKISKGGLVWVKRDAERGRIITWESFDEFARSQRRRERSRRK